ncbi:ABC transporter permease [Oleisolibacter albus]|uniref:ABC transporter permease n=1 Tax=Oleisolibacter albus TaxID=2171757 RepID=UPI000DF1FEBE|nr:ABC transporter permease [Oleisolibacter albus]
MPRLLAQIAAVTAINVKSMPQRAWLSASTVVAVALVVAVLLSFLAMANGFEQTLRGTGSPEVAVLLRGGAGVEINSSISRDQVRLVEEAPGIARGADGRPLVSAELYVTVDGRKRAGGSKANVTLRGMGPEGAAIRPGFRIVGGRMAQPGSAELMVGQSLVREFAGFDLGSRVRIANADWTVVGVFDMGGSVFESELWADIATVQSLFRRTNVFQSIRVRLDAPDRLPALRAYLDADPRLKLDAKSEVAYFADQASSTITLIRFLGWPLAIAMAVGALAGALNTMYSAVAARAQEIATLRCLGFGGIPSFVGTLIESLLLALLGGLLGAAVTWAAFDGVTASTLGSGFTQVVFAFRLSPVLVFQGVVLALVVGLLGGLFPAWRAAHVPIVRAYGNG